MHSDFIVFGPLALSFTSVANPWKQANVWTVVLRLEELITGLWRDFIWLTWGKSLLIYLDKSVYFSLYFLMGLTVSHRGDRTETGHVLGDPNRRDNADMLDTKNLSPVPFTVIRMLTHMALLLGVRSHHQVIKRRSLSGVVGLVSD